MVITCHHPEAEISRLEQQKRKKSLDEKAREAKCKGKGRAAKGHGRGQGRGKGRGKGRQPKKATSKKTEAKAKATAKSKSKKKPQVEAPEAHAGDEAGEVKKPGKRSRAKATIPEPAPAKKPKTKEDKSTFAGRYKPTTETMGQVWEALRRKYMTDMAPHLRSPSKFQAGVVLTITQGNPTKTKFTI